jgi:hypothetical protein
MAGKAHVDPSGLDSEHDYADLEEEVYSMVDRAESVPRSRKYKPIPPFLYLCRC